jgi:hypothetical protein
MKYIPYVVLMLLLLPVLLLGLLYQAVLDSFQMGRTLCRLLNDLAS